MRRKNNVLTTVYNKKLCPFYTSKVGKSYADVNSVNISSIDTIKFHREKTVNHRTIL